MSDQTPLKNPIPYSVARDRFGKHENAGTRISSRMLGASYFKIVDYCKEHRIPKFIKPPFGKFNLPLALSGDMINTPCVVYDTPIMVSPKNTRLVGIRMDKREWMLGISIRSEILSKRVQFIAQKLGDKVKKQFDRNLMIALTYHADEMYVREFLKSHHYFPHALQFIGETVSALQVHNSKAKADHDLQMMENLTGDLSLKTHTARMMEECPTIPQNRTAAMVMPGTMHKH